MTKILYYRLLELENYVSDHNEEVKRCLKVQTKHSHQYPENHHSFLTVRNNLVRKYRLIILVSVKIIKNTMHLRLKLKIEIPQKSKSTFLIIWTFAEQVNGKKGLTNF